VHPYLRRRQGHEPVRFPSPAPEHGPADELERVLGKTLGVPLFQEQAMRIAIEAAKFTPDKANALRRAMATFRNIGTIHKFQAEMVEGMVARGYDRDFSAACFRQIEGFGTYGFPESHAASFALLVYVSSWLKCHHPAAFACALLNSQPMGFYAPAQIIRDARAHGVEVREIDINASTMDCTLEDGALRLGLRMIDGFHAAWAPLIEAHRPYRTLDDLAALPRPALEHLAQADALRCIHLPRRLALWRIATMQAPSALFPQQPERLATPALPVMSTGEHVIADYRHTGFSIRAHPCALLRDKFAAARIMPIAAANAARDGARVRIGGLVTVRQRPGTAKGTVFITLEDETGIGNLIVWPGLVETFRHEIIHASLLIVDAKLQRSPEGVTHLVAERLTDRTRWIADLDAPLARADEFSKPRRPPSHPRDERVIPKSRDFH
jgi:error-prone DNA polymerase